MTWQDFGIPDTGHKTRDGSGVPAGSADLAGSVTRHRLRKRPEMHYYRGGIRGGSIVDFRRSWGNPGRYWFSNDLTWQDSDRSRDFYESGKILGDRNISQKDFRKILEKILFYAEVMISS